MGAFMQGFRVKKLKERSKELMSLEKEFKQSDEFLKGAEEGK